VRDVFAPPAVDPAHVAAVRARAPRLLVAGWCGAAAVLHGVSTLVMFNETLPTSGAEGWAIPFALGMGGAALTATWAAVRPPRTTAPDALLWAWLLLAAGAAVVPLI